MDKQERRAAPRRFTLDELRAIPVLRTALDKQLTYEEELQEDASRGCQTSCQVSFEVGPMLGQEEDIGKDFEGREIVARQFTVDDLRRLHWRTRELAQRYRSGEEKEEEYLLGLQLATMRYLRWLRVEMAAVMNKESEKEINDGEKEEGEEGASTGAGGG